eukprot:TRINITY_DN9791_c0_g1_i1.p1 TRINITY_DN9791_c0_g1~~TRINITY_DN9791_c0_g1_i1.p1  ORF type:complete len:410 (+),score=84.19 TRINITY_DN9791_c0_g1_i1:209-1438(+)
MFATRPSKAQSRKLRHRQTEAIRRKRIGAVVDAFRAELELPHIMDQASVLEHALAEFQAMKRDDPTPKPLSTDAPVQSSAPNGSAKRAFDQCNHFNDSSIGATAKILAELDRDAQSGHDESASPQHDSEARDTHQVFASVFNLTTTNTTSTANTTSNGNAVTSSSTQPMQHELDIDAFTGSMSEDGNAERVAGIVASTSAGSSSDSSFNSAASTDMAQGDNDDTSADNGSLCADDALLELATLEARSDPSSPTTTDTVHYVPSISLDSCYLPANFGMMLFTNFKCLDCNQAMLDMFQLPSIDYINGWNAAVMECPLVVDLAAVEASLELLRTTPTLTSVDPARRRDGTIVWGYSTMSRIEGYQIEGGQVYMSCWQPTHAPPDGCSRIWNGSELCYMQKAPIHSAQALIA